MRGRQKVESGKDRKMFVRDAGIGPVSFISILAGTLVAFASFAVLLAIVGGILAAVGIDTATLTANDYEQLGIGSAIVAALVLFLSYFFGGYIAGRLARRSGALNGGLVLVLAIVIGAVVALVVGTQTETENAAANLRVIGVPTSGADYGTIATVAGIVTLLAMIAGAVLGGLKGERWHGKLATRAFDPTVGPEAAGRQQMVEAEQRRTEDYHRPEPEQSDHRSRRPWATQPVATSGPTTQEPTTQEPMPAYQEDRGSQPVDRGAPAPAPTSGGWSDSESRAWGTPSSQPTGAQPAGADDRPGLAEEEAPRPRRARPLRSGRRS
jgi:membrane protease YdiL (CAAX protease family)